MTDVLPPLIHIQGNQAQTGLSKRICILSICELGIWRATTSPVSHESHCVNKEACRCMIISTMAAALIGYIHGNEFTSTRKWNSYTAIQTKPTILGHGHKDKL